MCRVGHNLTTCFSSVQLRQFHVIPSLTNHLKYNATILDFFIMWLLSTFLHTTILMNYTRNDIKYSQPSNYVIVIAINLMNCASTCPCLFFVFVHILWSQLYRLWYLFLWISWIPPWISTVYFFLKLTAEDLYQRIPYVSVIEGTAPRFVFQTFDSPNLSPLLLCQTGRGINTYCRQSGERLGESNVWETKEVLSLLSLMYILWSILVR